MGRCPSGWPPPPYPRRQPIRRKDIQRTQTDRRTETPFVHSFQYSWTKGPEKRTHRRRQSIREIPPPGAPFPKPRMYNLCRHVVPYLHPDSKTIPHQPLPRLRPQQPHLPPPPLQNPIRQSCRCIQVPERVCESGGKDEAVCGKMEEI